MKAKSFLRKIKIRSKILLDHNIILAYWYHSKKCRNNWGDALNPVLIGEISGKQPVNLRKYPFNIKNIPVYAVIGSILGGVYLNKFGKNRLVVWGTGSISVNSRLKTVPREICAVRGPLTREILINQGFDCPEIYGDPALLYPKFYSPPKTKKYKLGIIPHYMDKNLVPEHLKDEPDVSIINIQGGINQVVDEICKCQRIASTSLHGLIAADAYGVPSSWIRFHDKTVVGGDWKYRDYFYSVGRDEQVFNINEETLIDEVYDSFHKYKLDFDEKALWDACPFKE